MYYIPVSNEEFNSCVSLEKGGTDPFGNWVEAYVVVNYDSTNYSYDYYFTFYDDAGYGMALTKIDDIDLNGSKIKNPSPVNAENITTQLNDRAIATIVFEKETDGKCFGKAAKVGSGTGTEIGDVIKVGKEEFYVIDNSSSTITMLTKKSISLDINNPIQTSTLSTITFSSTNYWHKAGVTYPTYVYNENSNLYQYVNAYEKYLHSLGLLSAKASLISSEELNALGCDSVSNTCNNSPYSWTKLSQGTYWTGTATNYYMLEYVVASGRFDAGSYSALITIRPIITIEKSEVLNMK
jgi:hypothetical protein